MNRDGAVHLEDLIGVLANRAAHLRLLAANVVAGAEDGEEDVVRDNLKWVEEAAKDAAIEALDVASWARTLSAATAGGRAIRAKLEVDRDR